MMNHIVVPVPKDIKPDHIASQGVLKRVDQLRELNIGAKLSLPQVSFPPLPPLYIYLYLQLTS